MAETYHYGQGKIYLAELINNVPAAKEWVGDVSALSISVSEESFGHQESFSGKRQTVRTLYTGVTVEGSMTIHELGTENIARFTMGTATDQTAGTVSDESLGTVAEGDVINLGHFGITNLVITDSATPTPETIAPTHYTLDAFGDLTINSLPTPAPTQPLKASFAHAASKQAALLNASRKEYALYFEGINLAEGGKPLLVELYKNSVGLLQQLALINNDQALASSAITFTPLLDTSKPEGGDLGQYGRVVTVGY